MHINFLLNAICLINTIIIGGSVIECVNPYKISWAIIDKDIKWNSHVAYITEKAGKKL